MSNWMCLHFLIHFKLFFASCITLITINHVLPSQWKKYQNCIKLFLFRAKLWLQFRHSYLIQFVLHVQQPLDGVVDRRLVSSWLTPHVHELLKVRCSGWVGRSRQDDLLLSSHWRWGRLWRRCGGRRLGLATGELNVVVVPLVLTGPEKRNRLVFEV